jgi:hypothetical protein
MNEVLQGVIIGGVISLLGTALTLCFYDRQWRKEKKVEQLRLERNKLENVFTRMCDDVRSDLKTDAKPFCEDAVTDMVFCPPKVESAFLSLINADPDIEEKMKEKYFLLVCAMKDCLAEIDKRIDRELS